MVEENPKPEVRDLRNGDWLWINKQILEDTNLKASDKLVYSALAYFAGNTNQMCYPSISQLMQLTGLTRPTIINAIKNLENRGYIKVERSAGRISVYYLLKINQLKILTSKKEDRTSKKEDMTSKKEELPSKKEEHEQYLYNNTYITKLNINNTSSKEEGRKSQSSYGNKEINELIEFFEKQLGGSLDGSVRQNRRFAYLLINKFKKDYPDKDPAEGIKFLIQIGLKDDFHSKNLTNFKYLYYNAQKIIQSFKGRLNKIAIIKTK